MSCRICDSVDIAFAYTLFDDRYGYSGNFNLMRCDHCGHMFLQHDFTAGHLMDLYSNYYPRSSFDLDKYKPHEEKVGFMSWFDGSRSSAFRWVPRNVRILDIGCGFGESLGYHAARGCDVYGVEADENIRRVADKFGYNVHVGLFDPDIYEENFFDYVTMDQVLEHVVDPLDTLHGVARVLKPGGRAVISVPNAAGWGAKFFGDRWINWHSPYHLQFYSKKSMEIAAKGAGLELLEVQTITASAWLHYQWLHLLTYPEPGQPSEFWSKSACGKPTDLTLSKKIGSVLLAVIYRAKINHLITRFFDAFGVGDSQTFILRKP